MAAREFGAFKEALATLLVDQLRPIAAATQRLLDDPVSVDAVLRDGAERAAAIADPNEPQPERLVGIMRAKPATPRLLLLRTSSLLRPADRARMT